MIRCHGTAAMLKRRNERALQNRALRESVSNAQREGRREGRKERDEEYTLYVAAPKDGSAVCIGDQPKHEYIRIALSPRAPGYFSEHASAPSRYGARLLTFRAVKHARAADSGQTVLWWGWELVR